MHFRCILHLGAKVQSPIYRGCPCAAPVTLLKVQTIPSVNKAESLFSSENSEAANDIPLAFAYRTLAAGFQLSAKELLGSIEVRPDGTPAKYTAVPFLFLISHAAELYLKAALLKRGHTGNDLKKYDYRHNLKALLRALQEKGVSVTPDTINLIHGLHSQHQTHALRYSVFVEGQKTYMPPLAATLEMLDELLMLTRIST